jgi:hypothetical protein
VSICAIFVLRNTGSAKRSDLCMGLFGFGAKGISFADKTDELRMHVRNHRSHARGCFSCQASDQELGVQVNLFRLL